MLHCCGPVGTQLSFRYKSSQALRIPGDDQQKPCLQNNRVPTPPPSSCQEVGRVTRGRSKPGPAAVSNKKRKHGNHSSNSESQGTPPDSSFSKGDA